MKEIELCYYAEIGDRDGLESAVDQEAHEQWEHRVMVGEEYRGKARVRMTKRKDGIVYEETLKIPSQSNQTLSNDEETVPISEAYFQGWKLLFGDVGTIKMRYVFLSKEVTLTLGEGGEEITLPEVKFEVDVLHGPDGKKSRWCKIDIEIDHLLEILEERNLDPKQVNLTVALSNLPFKPQNPISAVTQDPEERAGIEAFWKRFSWSREG